MATQAFPLTAIQSLNLKASKSYLKTRTRKLSLPRTVCISGQRLPLCPSSSLSWPPMSRTVIPRSSRSVISSAYVSGPAFDAIVSDNNEFKEEGSSEAEESAPEPDYVISWGLLWRLVCRNNKLRLLISVLTLIGCTTCTLSMPLYSGKFFEVLVGRRSESLVMLLSKIGILYTLEPIFTVIFIMNMNAIWEKVMSSLRAQIFQRVLIQKVEFFDRHKVGELTSLLTSDLGSLKSIVSENISRDRGFRALSEVLGTITLLFVLSPQLAPILGFLMLTVSTFVALYRRTTVSVFKAHGVAQASIADCVNETLSAIRTVRSFSGERRQMSMFARQVLEYQSSGIKLGAFKSFNESLTRIAVYVSLMALYVLGGSKVKTGEMTVGTMASFIGYTFTLTFAVQGLVNTFGDLRGAFAATDRINSVLSESDIDEPLAYALQKEIKQNKKLDKEFEFFDANGSESKAQYLDRTYRTSSKSSGSVRSLAGSGDIHLEDVYFSYPLRPDVEILRGLDLNLRHGTVTALVGPSGAGKSTIVQLLARFYEPTSGRITVGGEDVRTFDKREWARVVSIVNQEPVLFSVSVGENIAYGLPDESVSRDDVIKAAKAANAHDFIIALPQGYDTLVGERGGLLSGGQRQRIAIARSLLKNAPILILDEATSALDAVSERLVQNALNRLMKGRTTLVIAHRLSTVQNADQIALCSDGKIAELGTHSELLNRKGQYAALVGTQRLAFE